MRGPNFLAGFSVSTVTFFVGPSERLPATSDVDAGPKWVRVISSHSLGCLALSTSSFGK